MQVYDPTQRRNTSIFERMYDDYYTENVTKLSVTLRPMGWFVQKNAPDIAMAGENALMTPS